jgi:curved DNA-binding protein CbpA
MSSHYRTLNLHHNATPDEIHRAYRVLAREYHPDRNPNAGAVAEMIRINEAYESLSDPGRRRTYDERFVASEPAELQAAVLDAAREELRKTGRNWCDTGDGNIVNENGECRVAIQFLGVLGSAELNDWAHSVRRLFARGLAHSAVLIAYRVVVPDEVDAIAQRSEQPLAAIDLVCSRAFGATLAMSESRPLFERFLLD